MLIQTMEMVEAGISVLFKSVKKTRGCKYAVINNQVSCLLYHYVLDSSMDMMHHCASCKSNTKSPTTSKTNVRFS